jgi:uncharacterized OB-fold protein
MSVSTFVHAPLPAIDADTQPFWDGAKRGELLIQRCTACARFQFYPRARCVRCGGGVAWVAARGTGRVYSYTVVHRAPHESLAADVPYVVALVDLDEGVRMMTRLLAAPDAYPIGAEVRVIFQRVSEDVAIPFFEIVPR